MPTDAEWEYAAQWDDERIYPWGDEDPDCSCANFYTGTYCVYWTTPVGSYPDAPEVLGLSDMAGNLFCTAPGSLDTSMHYAASARASSRRAWAGLRNPIFSINHS